mgnify:FL=1
MLETLASGYVNKGKFVGCKTEHNPNNERINTSYIIALDMKIRVFLSISLVAAMTFASCGKSSDKPKDDPIIENPDDPDDPDDPDNPSQTLIIRFDGKSYQSNSSLQLEHKKDAIIFLLETNPGWTADADADWIQLAALQGEAGKMGLMAGFASNPSLPRSATITFKSGDKTHLLKVSQKGAPKIRVTINEVSFDLILIEGGSFIMGNSDIPESRFRHTVNLSSFYMAQTETTNGLWEEIMGALPYDKLADFEGHNEYERPFHPVSGVSWNAIFHNFLPELKRRTGLDMQLPTEAQWEYAVAGGIHKENYNYSGSDELDKVAWNYYNCDDKQEVATLSPNALGIYDMSGNLSEWCRDWYKAPYVDEGGVLDPAGPAEGTQKVVRGGDFGDQTNFDLGTFYIRDRQAQVPGCYDGCWGNSGHPDEPECFFCDKTGFRMVLEF